MEKQCTDYGFIIMAERLPAEVGMYGLQIHYKGGTDVQITDEFIRNPYIRSEESVNLLRPELVCND